MFEQIPVQAYGSLGTYNFGESFKHASGFKATLSLHFRFDRIKRMPDAYTRCSIKDSH